MVRAPSAVIAMGRARRHAGADSVSGPSAQSGAWQVGGRALFVSHPEKVYWPEDGVTKGELLAYYQSVTPVMLPHLRDRPLTLRVYPNGLDGFSYYRREAPEHAPDWLRTTPYQPKTTAKPIALPLVDDAAGLLWLANQGCIEFHCWGSRVPNLAQPDQAIFDLDPGDAASFPDVLRAALRLRAALDELGLRGYPKTSGGRGVHVAVPLAPGHSFASVRGWVKSLAQRLAASAPDLIAVAHGATHRGRQVTIDYAQNSMGRNTAAAYTARAQRHATVSAPLTWDEVAAGDIRPADLTVRTMPERLSRLGDLHAPALLADQRLPPLGR